MTTAKRVALSLTVSEHARDALKAKAAREGHRYPAALAASIVERAVMPGPLSVVASAPALPLVTGKLLERWRDAVSMHEFTIPILDEVTAILEAVAANREGQS